MIEAPEANRRAPRVLIVDDDPTSVKFLTDRCVKMGLVVESTASGFQALSMARESPPDALIVDVHMPELDGLSLCSRMLNPEHFDMEVIVMSGYSDPGTEDRCRSLGATYVRKGPEAWARIHDALHAIFPGMAIEARDASAQSQVRERPLILVIDDDPSVGKFLTTRLRKRGADVLFTTDGKLGYQIAVRETPSAIISDYFMPVATINFLLWRLRSTPGMEHLPVFAMSGRELDKKSADDLINGQLGRRGAEQIFKKPLDIEEVLSALRKYCTLDGNSTAGDVVLL